MLTGLVDGLSSEVTDTEFIAKVYAERASVNQILRKNGDAISDYKRAIGCLETLDTHDVELLTVAFPLHY